MYGAAVVVGGAGRFCQRSPGRTAIICDIVLISKTGDCDQRIPSWFVNYYIYICCCGPPPACDVGDGKQCLMWPAQIDCGDWKSNCVYAPFSVESFFKPNLILWGVILWLKSWLTFIAISSAFWQKSTYIIELKKTLENKLFAFFTLTNRDYSGSYRRFKERVTEVTLLNG